MPAFLSLTGRNPAPAALLESTETSPEIRAQLQEDLAVMSRILERAAGDQLGAALPPHVMGVELITFGQSSGTPRTTFLEDYGALFTLQVRFPLLPPDPQPGSQAPDPTPVDSEWEAARRDVYGGFDRFPRHIERNVRVSLSPDTRTIGYEETKVRALQDSLLQALKHGNRIRHLKPSDFILVSVQGAPNPNQIHARTRIESTSRSTTGSRPAALSATHTSQGAPGAVMTIRVTKADADAFAQGTLDADAFRSRARIHVYPSTNPDF
jgi:hypothetical protein